MNDLYAGLSKGDRELVASKTERVRALAKQAVEASLEIGKELLDLRIILREQAFIDHVSIEFGWSRATAYRYIQLYKRLHDLPNLNLERVALSALHLLVAPSTPEPAVAEIAELSQTEDVSHEATRGIVAMHRDADDDDDKEDEDTEYTEAEEEQLLELDEEEEALEHLERGVSQLTAGVRSVERSCLARPAILQVLKSAVTKLAKRLAGLQPARSLAVKRDRVG